MPSFKARYQLITNCNKLYCKIDIISLYIDPIIYFNRSKLIKKIKTSTHLFLAKFSIIASMNLVLICLSFEQHSNVVSAFSASDAMPSGSKFYKRKKRILSNGYSYS